MECTQRLECTQDLCDSQQEKTYPDQIGVLGICGKTYPVKKGPNKIGRDPATCNIVLDLNSVSRQHAVINILNSTEFMIMDLDSANKTKLLNKTLLPYIPHVLKHGDTVQFGQVFGVFRLLTDNSDLPMTQALDIPDTPLVNRYASKLSKFPTTIIPESPNISDKDESFIATSQSKNLEVFKNTNGNFIKCSGNTVVIQPMGTNKIDNIFWNSSKKSVSMDMGLDRSIETTENFSSLKSSDIEENLNIHEMETQVPFSTVTSGLDTIYTANTQICTTNLVHSSISGVETSLVQNKNLPDIQNVNNQLEMKLDLFVENKENNNSIYNAEKRQLRQSSEDEPSRDSFKDPFAEHPKTNHNISDEEILFEEVESQPVEEDFGSQPLIQPESSLVSKAITTNFEKENPNPSVNHNDEGKTRRNTHVNSDSSTDCEDFNMLLTQKIVENKEDESKRIKSVPGNNPRNHKKNDATLNIHDDSTDCEDNVLENKEKYKLRDSFQADDDSTDCEDDIIFSNSENRMVKELESKSTENFAKQTISADISNPNENVRETNFEEMLTQVIEEVDIEKVTCTSENTKVANIEDLSTQLIQEEIITEKVFEQSQTLVDKTPFKVPMQSVKIFKRREVTSNEQKNACGEKVDDCVKCDNNFYTATQEIVNDLCSQKETCLNTNELVNKNHDQLFAGDNLCESSDGENKSKKLKNKLSSPQIKDISVVQVQTKRKIVSSDSSDVESTPKKIRTLTFMETELPNSQEIKKSVTLNPRTLVVESFSDSEPDNDLEEEYSPILHHKLKKRKNTQTDLTKMCLLDQIPAKVIKRIRKPTAKVLNSSLGNKNYLLPRFVIEQEENIDTDIITENIARLKGKKKDIENVLNENDESKLLKIPISSNYKKDLKSSLNLSKRQSSKKDVVTKNNGRRKENDSKTSVNKIPNEGNNDKKCGIPEPDNQKSLKLENDHKSQNKIQRSKLFEESVDSPIQTLKRSSRIKTKIKHKDQPLSSNITKMDVESNDIVNETSKSLSTTQGSSKGRRKDIANKPENKKETNISDEKDRKKRNHREGNGAESPERELRRSKRQRIVKQSVEAITEKNSKKCASEKTRDEYNGAKSHKKTNDSTVFSISSGSGIDSPRHKSFETPPKSNLNLDVKKKITTQSSDHHTSTRVAPRHVNTQFVLFTAFPSEEVKSKLEKLGAVIVTDVKACTVLLTLEIKRTFKLLCAVGLGRPIVGPSWVQACVDTKIIVDPWKYLIKDEAKEKRFQFNLQRTLTGKRNFLKGYNVSSTPSVMPASMEMKLIVQCSGGVWKEGGPSWLCVSSSADKALWATLKRRGATIVNTELILGGALRQKLDIDRNKLA